MKKTILLLSSLLLTSNVYATTLTFDGNGSLTDETIASYQGAGDTYTQDGYTLTVGAGDHFDTMSSSGLYWHDGSANTNHDNFAYLTFSGGLFDLTSFDFNTYAGDLLTNLNPLATYSAGSHIVNLTGLTWAAFSPSGTGSANIYLDNVVVSPSAVPIPAAAALFAPALLGFMGFRRKAKNKAV